MPLGLSHCIVQVGGVTVLQDVTLSVPPGQVTALMGPSGVGKTTILRVLWGDLLPASGTVERPFSYDQMAWIPQSAPVLPRRTALANVALGPYSLGLSEARAIATAAIALATLGMTELADREARKLSGGERQRVAVARALAGARKVVLADEPTASLDAQSRDTVVSALRKVAMCGGTVLVATHDLAVAAQCDSAIVVENRRTRVVAGLADV